MVWIGNEAHETISVSITSVHTHGGATGFFPVEPGYGSYSTSHWQRNATGTETAVIRMGQKIITVPDVPDNDFLLIFSDTYLKVPTEVRTGTLRRPRTVMQPSHSKARKTSPLKGLQRYSGKEGVLQMARGSKHPEKTTFGDTQYGMAKGVPQLQKILHELVSKVYKSAYKDRVILVHGIFDGPELDYETSGANSSGVSGLYPRHERHPRERSVSAKLRGRQDKECRTVGAGALRRRIISNTLRARIVRDSWSSNLDATILPLHDDT
ncbi:hypothetical protein BDN71DRAFT_1437189 [Pleurotus eryngii]|uniref:Uncharacterized protein n=1 Tax=Pleurotus eryngii TaxID=5323 RepID=A0A9P5ZF84_PLEER|nr:hypothetical protein BDN71DRAFT_1437189 [Pleurotus eryngii]